MNDETKGIKGVIGQESFKPQTAYVESKKSQKPQQQSDQGKPAPPPASTQDD